MFTKISIVQELVMGEPEEVQAYLGYFPIGNNYINYEVTNLILNLGIL